VSQEGTKGATNHLESCFYNIETHSLKVDTYFENYESVFENIKKPNLVVVEIGVLDGGSLKMWKSFFGKTSRIVGIEKNPKAKALRSLGFEIYIADQESISQLEEVFREIGSVDILIDDGGHTARGQIISSLIASKYMRDGGVIIVEDTHSSFAADFGMPHKFSFANWVHQVSDLMDQSYLVNKGLQNVKFFKKYPADVLEFTSRVHQIRKYRSMTIFEIRHNSLPPKTVDNMRGSSTFADSRWIDESQLMRILLKLQNISEWKFSGFGNTNSEFRFLNILTNPPLSLIIRTFLKPLLVTFKSFQKIIRRSRNNDLSEFFKS